MNVEREGLPDVSKHIGVFIVGFILGARLPSKKLALVIRAQALKILALSQEIEQMQYAVLANQQAYRDLAVAWRISIERPEDDIREDLELLIQDLSDQVATLEEHVM